MGDGTVRRVVLPDIRGNGRYLRVTWHPRSSTVVFSHWVQDVCVGSTQVDLPQVSKVVSLVVDALQEAVSTRATELGGEPARRSLSILNRWVDRFRTASAQIVALADRAPAPPESSGRAGSG